MITALLVVLGIVCVIVAAIVKKMLVEEASGWVTPLSQRIIENAAARLPRQSERYEEEWLGELAALSERKLTGLVFAIRVLQGARSTGAALEQAGDAEGEQRNAAEEMLSTRRQRRQPKTSSTQYGIKVEGVDDVALRLAKCCRPVPGDGIVGYVSLGGGVTIHREDCPNAVALHKDPDRFTPVSWEGDHEVAFKIELRVDAWDRHRLLEDLSRSFAEAGINIVETRYIASEPHHLPGDAAGEAARMVQSWFVVEVGDLQYLKHAITRLRSIESVCDCYRVTPGDGWH